MSVIQTHYREPARSQPQPLFDKMPFIVRTAMPDHPCHSLQQLGIDRSVSIKIEYAAKSAHRFFPSPSPSPRGGGDGVGVVRKPPLQNYTTVQFRRRYTFR